METRTELNQPTVTTENRSGLLKDTIAMTIQTAHSLQQLNDQQITQVLGNLVRSKLMNANDSYLLKDRLLDRDSIDRAIDHRIEAALKRRSLVSDESINQIRHISGNDRRPT